MVCQGMEAVSPGKGRFSRIGLLDPNAAREAVDARQSRVQIQPWLGRSDTYLHTSLYIAHG